MNDIPISKVVLSERAHLHVQPADGEHPAFGYVYRTAGGIRWEPNLRAFVAHEPSRWRPIDLYRAIVGAVASECGVCLTLTPDTEWLNVSSALKLEIEAVPPPERIDGTVDVTRMRDYVGDLRALDEMRESFRSRHYADVVDAYARLRYPDQVSVSQRRMVAIARQRLRT